MIEQTDCWYFSIDWRDQTESRFKRRCGLLQRQTTGGRISKSVELNTPADAKPLIPYPVPASALKIRSKDATFTLAKLLRDNEPILTTIRQLALCEWKVIFRASHSNRIILEKDQKEKKTEFNYYSILIKLKLSANGKFIEIGQGSVQTPKFNQDGLSTRVKKIVDNHRDSAKHRFSGKVPAILNAGDGAILFHELLGHLLEADYVYHRQSPFSVEHLGKPIISKNITLVSRDENDSFFKGIGCDDEGRVPDSPVLIEKGVLRNFVSDSYYQQMMKLKSCGHARVDSFTRNPMPRMYSLYIKPGTYHPEELVASTPYGVYAGEFGEGKINFEKNLFYFHIREAWLVQDGKLTDPLGSVLVKGNISEVLNSVAMVADDFRYDKGISYCSKNGQILNVRVGQPTVKINNLYVSQEFGFQ